MHLHGGGILVNSGNGNAADNDQNAAGNFTTDGYSLDVNGTATGHWTDLGIAVNAGHSQVADPFAGFPRPSTSSMTVYNSLPGAVGGVVTLDPGVYKVLIKGAGNDDFHMNPGVYIIEAGLDTSGNAVFDGSNVFLFNTYSTYPSAPGASPSCSDVNLTGNGAITLSAQTTGTWKNLLFYQDAACTNDMQIGGNGLFDGTGSFYLPNAPYVLDGNQATLNGSQLVAKTVNIQNGNLTINYDPNTTAQPILPRLAE